MLLGGSIEGLFTRSNIFENTWKWKRLVSFIAGIDMKIMYHRSLIVLQIDQNFNAWKIAQNENTFEVKSQNSVTSSSDFEKED